MLATEDMLENCTHSDYSIQNFPRLPREFKFPVGIDIETDVESRTDHSYSSRSRHNSSRTPYETDFEGSINNFTIGSRSNTESFSELRFSTSESHTDYSDSDTSTETNNIMSANDFNLIDQFPEIASYPVKNKTIDVTSGILYELCEQINKVPRLLCGSSNHIMPVSSTALESNLEKLNTKYEVNYPPSENLCNEPDGSLEERVYRYFSQNQNSLEYLTEIPLTGIKHSKGNEELEELEAAVERMLSQVEIQEKLLKEDLNFVPLVLESKEVKALPILVDTLCVSPQQPRRNVSAPLNSPPKLINNESSQEPPSHNCNQTYLMTSKTCHDVNFPLIPVPNQRQTRDYNMTVNLSNERLPSCSINELELSVNKLLSDVEKEEARLTNESTNDSKRLRSTTEPSSEGNNSSVWWEGVYRSLPRSKPETKNLINKTNSNSLRYGQTHGYFCQRFQYIPSSDDSDTSTEYHQKSVRVGTTLEKPEVKLMVKTVDTGKNEIEIRTSNYFDIRKAREISNIEKCTYGKTSVWSRSLPTLYDSSTLQYQNVLTRTPGSDDSLSYQRAISDSASCIQYFIPVPTSQIENSGYCTWFQRHPGGKQYARNNNHLLIQ